jgi:hypothetical protein
MTTGIPWDFAARASPMASATQGRVNAATVRTAVEHHELAEPVMHLQQSAEFRGNIPAPTSSAVLVHFLQGHQVGICPGNH